MKAKVFLLVLFILNIFQVCAQKADEVTLVVSADGATKEEATKRALRSAIEQAYGTFVSANTTILNDEMVKDEIVTISNGNIKQYKEIASIALPNGNQSVTLQATVCISKLVSYAQSKGASTEFAGATFMMNFKMKELNKKNERIVLNNLLFQVKALSSGCFDRSIKMGTPKLVENNKYKITYDVSFQGNNRYFEIQKLIISTLKSIALSEEEKKEYESMGIETIRYWIQIMSEHYKVYGKTEQMSFISYLRNGKDFFDKWSHELLEIYCNELSDYKVVDNNNNVWCTGGNGIVINRRSWNGGICEYYGPDIKKYGYDKNYIFNYTYWDSDSRPLSYRFVCFCDSFDSYSCILTADEMSKLTKIDVIRK